MKIGILGGTFDPPHNGHLSLALAAREHLGLDEVILLPANRNPNKRGKLTPSAQRLEMTKLLVEDHEGLAVSDMEITRGGLSYMVDTLTELTFAQPADYWVLMGADALKNLPAWKQPERLLKLARIGVALRPPLIESEVVGRLPSDVRARVDLIPMPPMDLSSTDLRGIISRNQPASLYLPAKVLKYIQEQRLYKI